MQIPETAPFSDEQKTRLNELLPSMTPSQLQWLTGFAAAVEMFQQPGLPTSAPGFAPMPAQPALDSPQVAPPAAAPAPVVPAKAVPVLIVYGSESGNAEGLADDTKKEARKRGLSPTVKGMSELNVADLTKAKNLLIITSTWGDGDPPENAIELHSEFMASTDANFEGVNFSICALGDTSYDKFCQTGIEFDTRIAEFGGNRIAARRDCDVDYEADFREWLGSVLSALGEQVESAPTPAVAAPTGTAAAPVGGVGGFSVPEPLVVAPIYDKKNPFPAELTEKVLLSGTGSSKETWHYELSLAGSGLEYNAGDSLAILPKNAKDAVDALLEAGNFVKGSVSIDGGSQISLGGALSAFYDCTTLTKRVLEKYNNFAESKKIDRLLDDSTTLKEYLHGRQIVDMLEDFPVKELTGEDFVGLLRKLPPRLYSIASSLRANPDEVHLTVASVRYHTHGRDRKGVASTWLADSVGLGQKVSAYVAPNKHFKLPASGDTPMIMVGPGTGIAPFRAFLEERQALGATGRNWLFFGDRNFSYDFLYQLDLRDFIKEGVLSKLDVAFSRDQPEKVYVQDRMRENAAELWSWLNDGAVFYVCGDAERMAPDVHEALIDIAKSEGGKSQSDAEAYV
ncbi:MAG: sulfite reductase (NADPH) flavoprotein alpha-component, partial [Verrucomicrobiales bacterium]